MIITSEQIIDINAAFDEMLANTDLQKIATAMNVLCPDRKFYVTPELLAEKIKISKDITMSNWGLDSGDANVAVDLTDYKSSGSGAMGYLLQLCLDEDTEEWHWELNLEINSQWIYNQEEE